MINAFKSWIGFTEAVAVEPIETRRDYHDQYGRWPTKAEFRSNARAERLVYGRKRSKSYKRPDVLVRGKCLSCGSREYVYHNETYICSYCRSAAP